MTVIYKLDLTILRVYLYDDDDDEWIYRARQLKAAYQKRTVWIKALRS